MPAYVVVGAARGIGLSFIRHLAAQPGNTVIAVNRKPGQETVERVHEVMGDLTDLSTLQKAAKEIEEIAKDGVDVLIASAGEGQMLDVPLGEGKEAELAEALLKTFKTNTIGHLQFISLLLPQLRRGTGKKIAYLTSGHGIPSIVRMAKAQGRLPYATSKAAADVAIVRMSNQLRPEGFTVFSVTPGLVLDREAYRAQGNDPEALEQAIAKNWPGHGGIVSYDEGARLMLDVIDRFGPDDSGRVVGMWGTEDKMG